MARRWQVTKIGDRLQSTSIFQRLAGRLQTLQANSQLNPPQNMNLSAPLYESRCEGREPSRREWVTPDAMGAYMERANADLTRAALSDSTIPASVFDNEASHHDASHMMNVYEDPASISVLPWGVPHDVDISDAGLDNESLLAISETLTSQDFTNIDRIVTFENIMLGSFF
jgi:hypothetical protein